MKKRIKQKIILLSLIIGVIYALPEILFMIETRGNCRILPQKEIEVGLVRIREVYDGHYYIADPYIYENKSKPYFRTYFSELLLGILGKTLGLSIVQLFILHNFVFSIVLFLLIYCFLFILTNSQNMSLFGSSFILLTEFPEIILLLIKGSSIGSLSPSVVHISYSIFFILCLIFTYLALEKIKIPYIFLAAMFFGLLFYCHHFHWTHILATYILFSGYLIFKKSLRQFKALILIIVGGLIISIPYWINIHRLASLPYLSEMAMRFDLSFSNQRQPFFPKFTLVGIFLFLFFYRRRDFKFYLISALLFAGFLCMNQQVITGKDLGAWHWYFYTGRQTAMIAIVVLMSQIFNHKKIKRPFLILAFALLIASGLYIQLSYYKSAKAEQKEMQFLYDALQWLDKNTEVDSVVLASNSVSLILPVYTPNNVYTVGRIFESVSPDSELWERFFIFARLLGMDLDTMLAYLKDAPQLCFGDKFRDPKYKNIEEFFRLNRVAENISRRYEYFQKQDMLTLLHRFRVDYIFYSPYERKISKVDLNRYSFLQKVYDKNDIQIYKILK